MSFTLLDIHLLPRSETLQGFWVCRGETRPGGYHAKDADRHRSRGSSHHERDFRSGASQGPVEALLQGAGEGREFLLQVPAQAGQTMGEIPAQAGADLE